MVEGPPAEGATSGAPSGPSTGPRPKVAVTRSADDNRSLVRRLEVTGIEVLAVPLVEVVGPADGGAALVAAVDRLDTYRWVVLTSVNGVEAIADAVGDRPWPPGLRVAAVGPSTAEAARAVGMPVILVPEVATAAALVAAFPPAAGDAESAEAMLVLAPLAALAGRTVEDGLAVKGWRVDRVEAYRTRAPAEPDGMDPVTVVDGLDAVTLFSPSAVDRWVDRFGPVPAIAVCIGPSTGQRARHRGLARVVVAEPHSEDGVIAALARELDGAGGAALDHWWPSPRPIDQEPGSGPLR